MVDLLTGEYDLAKGEFICREIEAKWNAERGIWTSGERQLIDFAFFASVLTGPRRAKRSAENALSEHADV